MPVKRNFKQAEPKNFEVPDNVPVKKNKQDLNWEVEIFLQLLPFTLPEPDASHRIMVLKDLKEDKISKLDATHSVDPYDSVYEADVSSTSSDEDSDSLGGEHLDFESAEESDYEIIVPKKKRCGAMWSSQCRRAGRCICADDTSDYND
ncbi:17241_t:CDS:1 [Dentiscutata heterogama]|uniref:17241_t:CDS:1 n=1 Tax=Dentiscutata heterogama TaxID=1316150 RepID=A0ACA9JYN2_9GLOM|nr:17241_t:CDS:1 [Dentiscutata heterogama]